MPQTGAQVLAHVDHAAMIEGSEPPLKPRLTQLERPLAQMLLSNVDDLPGAQPEGVRGNRRLHDGDITAGGGPIVAIRSIAVFLPEQRVPFTDDSIASQESAPILGPFNLNPADAVAALRRQADLTFEIAYAGHGRPIAGGAGRELLAMLRSLARLTRPARRICDTPRAVRLEVHTHPNAMADRVEFAAGILRVWVRAPAVEGRANAAIERVLADALRLRPRQVQIVHGATSRRKLVQIDLTEQELRRRLP